MIRPPPNPPLFPNPPLSRSLDVAGGTADLARLFADRVGPSGRVILTDINAAGNRSEEHTSELQSQSNLVCRLLLEKKKKYTIGLLLFSTSTTAYCHATTHVH